MRAHQGHECRLCGGIVGKYHNEGCGFLSPNRQKWRKPSELYDYNYKPTDKVKRTLSLFAEGKSAKAVAFELNMPVGTLLNQLKALRYRYKVGTTTGLVAKALREGWIK